MSRQPHDVIEGLCDEQGQEWARLMLEEQMAMRAALEKRVEVRDEAPSPMTRPMPTASPASRIVTP